MPAGVKYDMPPEIDRELCDVESIYRPKDGGWDLDRTGLAEGLMIPPFAPLYCDKVEHKAYLVKNVRVVEEAAAEATSVKIAKGSAVDGSIYLTDGTNVVTVSAIDKTSSEDYDTLTVTALTAKIEKGKVLTEAADSFDEKPKRTANRVNYDWRKVVAGQTVTAVAAAYSVMEDNLYMPISEWDKETLTSRFQFI